MRLDSRRVIFAVCFLSLLTSILGVSFGAAPGDLDPTFGAGGKVITAFDRFSDFAQAVAIQDDQKIVVAGDICTAAACGGIGVARYTPSGALDPGFGVGGKVVTGIAGTGRAIAIQSDGKLLIAGSTLSAIAADIDFVVVRLNTDGTLDQSFGTAGLARTDFAADADFAFGVAIQSDGKIVLAGTAQMSGPGQDGFALARYDSHGVLDGDFGTDGKVFTPISPGNDEAHGVIVLDDGRIIVGGSTVLGFTLVRYSPNGSLDTTFGSGGIAAVSGSGIVGIARQTDGKIVCVGASSGAGFDFEIARFEPDGAPDTGFGSGGETLTDFFGGDDLPSGVAIQTDGRIVVVGFATNPTTNRDFALARYDPDGTLDPTFGVGGKITTDFGSAEDIAAAVAIQADGKIVAAGFTLLASTSHDFAVARYRSTSANFDTCVQDDSTHTFLRFDSTAGEYEFNICRSGLTGSGTGVVTRKGCLRTLQDTTSTGRILVTVDTCARRASGSVQIFSSGATFTITDRNTADDACSCK